MIQQYEGVIFECAVPDSDANNTIKQAEKEIAQYLDCKIQVQMHKAMEKRSQSNVEKGDYYLHFYTDGFRDNWGPENLQNAGQMIEEITGQKVDIMISEPWEIFVY